MPVMCVTPAEERFIIFAKMAGWKNTEQFVPAAEYYVGSFVAFKTADEAEVVRSEAVRVLGANLCAEITVDFKVFGNPSGVMRHFNIQNMEIMRQYLDALSAEVPAVRVFLTDLGWFE